MSAVNLASWGKVNSSTSRTVQPPHSSCQNRPLWHWIHVNAFTQIQVDHRSRNIPFSLRNPYIQVKNNKSILKSTSIKYKSTATAIDHRPKSTHKESKAQSAKPTRSILQKQGTTYSRPPDEVNAALCTDTARGTALGRHALILRITIFGVFGLRRTARSIRIIVFN